MAKKKSSVGGGGKMTPTASMGYPNVSGHMSKYASHHNDVPCVKNAKKAGSAAVTKGGAGMD